MTRTQVSNFVIKKILPLFVGALLLCNGCALIPHSVEFFQRKVKAVPEKSESDKNHDRQAAARIHELTEEARIAAINEGASTNVLGPIIGANDLSGALSVSLGPPIRPYFWSDDSLGGLLVHNRAELDRDIQEYADAVQKDVGKKIEGTGLIRLPYFAFAGGVFLVFFLLWQGIKLYGIVNPVVGTAAGAIGRVSSTILHTGFSELVTGGEQFKSWIQNSGLAADLKAEIINGFNIAHQTQQSPATQAVVDKLTTTAVDPNTVLPALGKPATPAQ